MAIMVLGLIQLSCGAAMTPAQRKCKESFQQMRDKQEDRLCSPILYNAFESRVTKWRNKCGDTAKTEERALVTQKLSAARECSDDKRSLEMLTISCSNQLKQVMKAQNCLGEECEPHMEEIKEIAQKCDLKRLNGKFKKEFESTTRMFEERIKYKDRLQALRNLIMTCDGIYDLNTHKQARVALAEIIDAVSLTDDIFNTPKNGTEVARFKKGALDSCAYALLGVTEVLCDVPPKEIARINSANRRQKRYIKKYQRYGDRLQTIYAAALFPNAMTPLTELLKKFGASEEKAAFEVIRPPVIAMETIEEEKETPTAEDAPQKAKDVPGKAETATAKADADALTAKAKGDRDKAPETEKAAGAATATGPTLSKADEKKCKAWKKKLKHFSAKANAYEKKGNQGKTKAYRLKQEKTRLKVEETGCPIS